MSGLLKEALDEPGAWSMGTIKGTLRLTAFGQQAENPCQQAVKKFGAGEAGRASDCTVNRHYAIQAQEQSNIFSPR
jgi:hypothetical protein